ncbi:MAG TPA: AMP-binding protein [Pyrinomonadaceae bacterium]|jgi:bile acid-coenzyme A ligase
MVAPDQETVHIGDRVGEIAASNPQHVALRFVGRRGDEQVVTYHELESQANACARALERHGVTERNVVGLVLGRCPEHLTVTLGAWKLGATVVPLNPASSPDELRQVASLPGVVLVGSTPNAAIPLAPLITPGDGSPMPGRGLPRAGAMTGGTTGQPRIILHERSWRIPRSALGGSDAAASGQRIGQVQLVVLPLHHAGFSALYYGLALKHSIVLLEEFTGALFFDAIERHRVNYVRLVPSYMRLALDAPQAATADLSSLEALSHGAAKCPQGVKRRWIELLGPERVYEEYSSMERLGRTRWITMIRGDEWLRHPGSVGRPQNCEVRIVGDNGQPLPAGEIGLVFVRAPGARQPTYLGDGQPLPEMEDFRSVGDLGYLDADGYLYLIGRSGEVINTGGRKVRAGEVEDVLLRHPAVADAAVVGVPHEYLGSALHAIVVPGSAVTPEELEAHCRAHLDLARVPLSYELRGDLGRSESGKLLGAVRAALGKR